MVFLGIIAAGGVFTGTNPGYTQYELAHHIKTAKAKFLITEPEMLGAVVAAGKECKIPHSRTLIFDVLGQEFPDGFKSWEVLLNHGEKDWERFDDEETAKNTTAARMFSSGTTGLPKAAMVSHYNLVAQHELVYGMDKRPYRVGLVDLFPPSTLKNTSREEFLRSLCSTQQLHLVSVSPFS
jgi:acyl-CoA synthetase (AMP-forming)/AMP-acid ligase II